MVKRSLIASPKGITTAKRAFERKGWTQSFLAAEVGLSTRQSVWKFFTGKPIDRNIFQEICFTLDLDWQTIADLPDSDSSDVLTDLSTENLDQSKSNEFTQQDSFITFKQQCLEHIKHQCTFLQSSLEIANPQSLDQLYTTTYLLPELTTQKWLEVPELDESNLRGQKGIHASSHPVISAVAVTQNYPKLFILGQAGSGKTTFLQYLALQCLEGQLFPDFIPVFIRLHFLQLQHFDFHQLDLVSVIEQQLNASRERLTNCLAEGKILLLLDGLDEISTDFQTILLQKILIFTELYHQNRVIITSRLANRNFYLRGFYYAEISEFTTIQIEDFVKKWFLSQNAHVPQQGEKQAQQFLKALDLKENQGLFELTRTPILLNFLCTLYYHRESFPNNRYKLYQAGLEILMVNWDQAKGIHRQDPLYQSLSVTNKIKLLSYLAEQNFQKGKYFFEKDELLHQIREYLLTFSDESFKLKDPEDLRAISEEILNSIELQHGLLVTRAKDVYSFSHLTFQEYLTARRLANMAVEKDQKTQLQKLASHVTDSTWHEVILMTSHLLVDDSMLLQLLSHEIDQLMINQTKLREFFLFLNQKAEGLNLHHKMSAVRGFYLGLLCQLGFNLANLIDVKISIDLSPDLALDLALSKVIAIAQDMVNHFTLHKLLDLTLLLDIERKYVIDQNFAEGIQQLKQQIPHSSLGKNTIQKWWSQEGSVWVQQLKELVNQYRYFSQDWQFSDPEKEILTKYYQASEFLVKCLYNSSQVDPIFQTQLENKLITVSLGDS